MWLPETAASPSPLSILWQWKRFNGRPDAFITKRGDALVLRVGPSTSLTLLTMPADPQFESFGTVLWAKLCQQPFGSLGKRELELAILDAATKAGLVQGTPDALASAMSLSLTKANSYLTDLALRRPALSDAEGHSQLATLLGTAEILPDNRHLSFAVHNPALKIWLDRKLAANQSHHGDGIRSNIAKLSPATLLSLLANTTTWRQVKEAVQSLYMLAVA